MFCAKKMQELAAASRKNQTPYLKILQHAIRGRALQGYDYYNLHGGRDANFVHYLREVGFKVVFDDYENSWQVRWDNDGNK